MPKLDAHAGSEAPSRSPSRIFETQKHIGTGGPPQNSVKSGTTLSGLVRSNNKNEEDIEGVSSRTPSCHRGASSKRDREGNPGSAELTSTTGGFFCLLCHLHKIMLFNKFGMPLHSAIATRSTYNALPTCSALEFIIFTSQKD